MLGYSIFQFIMRDVEEEEAVIPCSYDVTGFRASLVTGVWHILIVGSQLATK